MVHQVMLSVIDKRLRQATGKKDLYFGGISIILVSDPGQLPPIGGSALYLTSRKVNKDLETYGYNCYLQFKTVVVLEVSERQKIQKKTQNNNFYRFIDSHSKWCF